MVVIRVFQKCYGISYCSIEDIEPMSYGELPISAIIMIGKMHLQGVQAARQGELPDYVRAGVEIVVVGSLAGRVKSAP
jgi:hypothetical protein